MKPALFLALALVLSAPTIVSAADTEPLVGPPAQWKLDVTGDGATLSYAVPDSPGPAFGFSCPGGGDVDVYYPVTHRQAVKQDDAGRWVDAAGQTGPWSTKLTLTSGKATETITADVEADEMDGGSTVIIRINTQSPFLQAFGQTGKVTMEAYGEVSKAPPAPRGLARRFVSVCSK